MLFNKYPEFYCMLLCIILYAIISLATSNSVPLDAKKPRRIFSHDSSVLDFHDGNVDLLLNGRNKSDIFVVYFYALWSLPSIQGASAFSRAARLFQNEVTFVAVNCWYPKGPCRQLFRLEHFPVIYAYIGFNDGVLYRGPVNHEAIIRFTERAIRPIQYITSKEELTVETVKSEILVVGYFHLPQQAKNYSAFYHAVHASLVQSVQKAPSFAVITSAELAAGLAMTEAPSVVALRHLAAASFLPIELLQNTTATNEWIQSIVESTEYLTQWITISKTKSLSLYSKSHRNPLLMLLTPMSADWQSNDAYLQVREVAMAYLNCNRSSKEQLSETETSSRNYRLELAQQTEQWQSRCRGGAAAKEAEHECTCGEDSAPDAMTCEAGGDEQAKKARVNHSCLNPNGYYEATNHAATACCERAAITGDEVRRRYLRQQCRRRTYFRQSDHALPESPPSTLPSSWTGRACASNRTLTFVAVDSNEFGAILDSMGFRFENDRRTAVVIVDAQDESQYFLSGGITKQRIGQFVQNYTEKRLNNSQRSVPAASAAPSPVVAIVDLNSANFVSFLKASSDKDLCILFYAKWCLACTVFMHHYMEVASYFKEANIAFARIDADLNDLPWEYRVHEFPSLLLFPAGRSGDSVRFPRHIPRTLSNVVQFIVRYSKTHLKNFLRRQCDDVCLRANRRKVINAIDEASRKHRHSLARRADAWRLLVQGQSSSKAFLADATRQSKLAVSTSSKIANLKRFFITPTV